MLMAMVAVHRCVSTWKQAIPANVSQGLSLMMITIIASVSLSDFILSPSSFSHILHTAIFPCTGSNNCGHPELCSKASGSPVCSCRLGFSLGEDEKTCSGVNCTYSHSHPHTHMQTLSNLSFFIHVYTCISDTKLSFSLTDLNECATSNGGCSHTCTNTVGAFTCSCPTGFVLRGDFHVCTGVDQSNTTLSV